MTTLLLVFAFMLIMVTALAIGVLFGRAPISGSCGGMKALGMEVECEICGGDPNRCETTNEANPSQNVTDLARRVGR